MKGERKAHSITESVAPLMVLRNEIESLKAENARLKSSRDRLLEALKEISKREGAFSRDPLTHAENTIDSMAGIAEAAIKAAEQEG